MPCRPSERDPVALGARPGRVGLVDDARLPTDLVPIDAARIRAIRHQNLVAVPRRLALGPRCVLAGVGDGNAFADLWAETHNLDLAHPVECVPAAQFSVRL